MRRQFTVALVLTVLVAVGDATAQSARFTVSGPGVVGRDSVAVGQPFSLDLMLASTGEMQKAFTLGFVLDGTNGLKSISPVLDSTKDTLSFIKGHNGFEDASTWDFGKLQRSRRGWNGSLPDTLLLGGIAMNKGWSPSPEKKYISVAVMAASAGSLCVDTSYVPPGGKWMYVPGPSPKWSGKYCVTVVGKKK